MVCNSKLISITYSLNVTAMDHLSTPVFSESKIRMHGLQHSQHTTCTYTPQPLMTDSEVELAVITVKITFTILYILSQKISDSCYFSNNCNKYGPVLIIFD